MSHHLGAVAKKKWTMFSVPANVLLLGRPPFLLVLLKLHSLQCYFNYIYVFLPFSYIAY